MTRESEIWCLCAIISSAVFGVWCQATSPSNIFQYKAPVLTRSTQRQVVLNRLVNGTGKKPLFYPLINHQEQYPYRQGLSSGPHQYHDSSKLNHQQSILLQDSSQKNRNYVFADEPKPVDFTTTTTFNQPSHFPYQSNQKDSPLVDTAAFSKILNLAKALSKNPRTDGSRNYETMASASDVHQEVCAPPKSSNPPQNLPCTSTPQPVPSSPPSDSPSCQQSNPKPPTCSKANPTQPPISLSPPCPQPKLEESSYQPPIPAPMFSTFKHPFQSDSAEQFTNTAFVSVSPLHQTTKYPEPPKESPCTCPSCLRKKSSECEATEQPTAKQVVPIVPAAKPVVYSNPFSENKKERIVPVPPSPKGVLHHRQHIDENIGYPEAYISKPESQPLTSQGPYYVYQSQHQTVGRNPHVPTRYPYVPPPMTKPIPLLMTLDGEDHNEDDFFDVYYPIMEDDYHHIEKPSKRYNDDWSKEVLRNIADKLDAILDYDFRGQRFSSRGYPNNERGYHDDVERYEDESGPYARGHWDYYEEGFGNDHRKERKYSRRG